MKNSIPLLATALVLSTTSFGIASAQNAPAGAPASDTDHAAMLSFLSPVDRERVLKVHDVVIATNPDLKAQEQSLEEQRQNMKDASPEDRMALFEGFADYEKKMRTAMLQIDPTLQPVFDQIEEHYFNKSRKHATASNT